MPRYLDVTVPNGATVHYVEAGDSSKPTLVLLHGFPTSSTQYRLLIPLLSKQYHIYAPDLPGFGLTTVPKDYQHTFSNMATTIGQWLDTLQIKAFAVYIFDYGAPTLFRLALERPESIKAIITQNGNAYEEGLGPDFWAPLQQWWASGDASHKETREMISGAVLNVSHFKDEYTLGVPKDNLTMVDPSAWTNDYLNNAYTAEQKNIQLDLFYSYGSNVQLYPQFQQYLRDYQPPVLAVWGKGDPCFIPPGAEAYKRDVKNAEVHLLDGGHFLLETHVEEVADKVKVFLSKNYV
ncbi:Alpha/Beta hydrolase protein [Kockovaella imperatae]|uniref:Alpha/Beta hydrolase protein n=1 Tax=Kockovaella imperatae TaxID=4999 RepID=A0A1Y1URE6_9TREE|nr:Alpha/Beta hydrolase protein [Kockovaella imperatae]ORX40641.1 Alpha/Beta hydrolase protein [Kockovaella imperatae]